VKRPQHPFEVWLLAHHVDEDTHVGDLARDVRLDPDFPSEGERRDLRRFFEDMGGVDPAVLASFDEAWRLYEPDGSPADHPFATFLLDRDLRDATPLSTFAQEYANLLPTTGDRATLRTMVEHYLGYEPDGDPDEVDPHTSWTLTCFDVTWQQFRPTCEAFGCAESVDLQMSLCGVHSPLEDLL
jgi:hypothetical protein